MLIKGGNEAIKYTSFVVPNISTIDTNATAASSNLLPNPPKEIAEQTVEQTVEQTAKVEQKDIYLNAEKEAAQIIEQARAEAERIVIEAQHQAAEIEHAAREKGASEGHAAAMKETAAAIEPLRAQFMESLNQLADLRQQLAEQVEEELVRLAVGMAKKVVRKEVSLDREIAFALVKTAIEHLNTRSMAVVRLHPDDYQYVIEQREQISSGGVLDFVVDQSISRGGCLIETELGDLDARIEEQFAEIEKGILG